MDAKRYPNLSKVLAGQFDEQEDLIDQATLLAEMFKTLKNIQESIGFTSSYDYGASEGDLVYYTDQKEKDAIEALLQRAVQLNPWLAKK